MPTYKRSLYLYNTSKKPQVGTAKLITEPAGGQSANFEDYSDKSLKLEGNFQADKTECVPGTLHDILIFPFPLNAFILLSSLLCLYSLYIGKSCGLAGNGMPFSKFLFVFSLSLLFLCFKSQLEKYLITFCLYGML